MAQLIHESEPSLSVDALFTSFTAREKLGTTGLGDGIAIPHCRLANCQRVTGALVCLANPIDFEAIDGEPVDTLFALVVPEQATQEHLDVLAGLASLFSQADFRCALRPAVSNRELYETAVNFAG